MGRGHRVPFVIHHGADGAPTPVQHDLDLLQGETRFHGGQVKNGAGVAGCLGSQAVGLVVHHVFHPERAVVGRGRRPRIRREVGHRSGAARVGPNLRARYGAPGVVRDQAADGNRRRQPDPHFGRHWRPGGGDIGRFGKVAASSHLQARRPLCWTGVQVEGAGRAAVGVEAGGALYPDRRAVDGQAGRSIDDPARNPERIFESNVDDLFA